MAAVASVPLGEYVPTADQRVVLHGVSWAKYEEQLAIRGDRSVPRISYVAGSMELMSPSKDHERIKSYIGRLIETFALERGLDLSPYGAWTLKEAPKQAGVEPDECYLVGSDQSRDTPDLAIEVVWTSGGIDKLEAYRRLGVSEVWFWKNDRIQAYVLESEEYLPVTDSKVLVGLDFALLLSMLDHPTVIQSVRAYRAELTKPR